MLPIVFNMVPGAGTSLDRIGELMEYSETGIPDRPAVGPEAGTFSLSSDPIVSLEHVSFGYEGHKTTLEDISLEGYTTIYLGFPIWWGEEPRILDTFVEKYSFEGITVIPFCTSGSSGIGRSGPNMKALAGTGNWLDGKRFVANVSEADLKSWIDGLK